MDKDIHAHAGLLFCPLDLLFCKVRRLLKVLISSRLPFKIRAIDYLQAINVDTKGKDQF